MSEAREEYMSEIRATAGEGSRYMSEVRGEYMWGGE